MLPEAKVTHHWEVHTTPLQLQLLPGALVSVWVGPRDTTPPTHLEEIVKVPGLWELSNAQLLSTNWKDRACFILWAS